MKLHGVTFGNWLASHSGKAPKERWLRELYPWPVLAQVEFDESLERCLKQSATMTSGTRQYSTA
jgi:hypothetical protein